jgi:hypothetical protein
MNVMFVEAKSFSRRWPDYLTEEGLREFQSHDHPQSGWLEESP